MIEVVVTVTGESFEQLSIPELPQRGDWVSWQSRDYEVRRIIHHWDEQAILVELGAIDHREQLIRERRPDLMSLYSHACDPETDSGPEEYGEIWSVISMLYELAQRKADNAL